MSLYDGYTKKKAYIDNKQRGQTAPKSVIFSNVSTNTTATGIKTNSREIPQQIINGLNEVKIKSDFRFFSLESNIDNYLLQIEQLNTKIQETSLDSETKTKIRGDLCYVAREAAIKLHNSGFYRKPADQAIKTDKAIEIIKALIREFDDIPILEEQLNEDLSKLREQKRSPFSVKTQGRITVFIIVVIVIVAFFGCTSKAGNSSKGLSLTIPKESTKAYSSTIKFDKSGGRGGNETVLGIIGKPMPKATSPTKSGYDFGGYYSEPDGEGIQYYNSSMESVHDWDIEKNTTLYAYWVKQKETSMTSNTGAGKAVYVDAVSIFPEYGIYNEGSNTYHHFVCRCKTTAGSTIWIYISCSDYHRYFDSSVSTKVSELYADTVSFSSRKRIHGLTITAESILSGLGPQTDTVIVEFSSVN